MKTGALTFFNISALSNLSTKRDPKNHPIIAFAASYSVLKGHISISKPGERMLPIQQAGVQPSDRPFK